MSDFTLSNEGSIFLLTPVSEAGRAWADEHLPDDAQTLGSAIAVEHRYIHDIITGIQADGLEVTDPLTYASIRGAVVKPVAHNHDEVISWRRGCPACEANRGK